MTVHDLDVEIVRKDIKNLHLAVYPPDGRVRLATPVHIGNEALRLAIVTRLPWIRRQQKQLREQARESQREMIKGESHFFRGKRYLLDVIEKDGPTRVRIRGMKTLELTVRPVTSREKKEAVLQEWYREQIKAVIPSLIEKWEPVIGVKVSSWSVRKMRTLWGSCDIENRSIRLNLELIKKPNQCLEYILVHELVHLLERHHTDRFRKLMNQFMPQWRLHRNALNNAPLAYEDWKY